MYVNLNLSRYELATIKQLYWEMIITRSEFMAEIQKRGCDEWLSVEMVRKIESERV